MAHGFPIQQALKAPGDMLCVPGERQTSTQKKLYKKTLQNPCNRTLAPGSRREANQMMRVSKVPLNMERAPM